MIRSGRLMDAVVSAAAQVGAWIIAYEIYSGAELNAGSSNGPQTPSFWGRYDPIWALDGRRRQRRGASGRVDHCLRDLQRCRIERRVVERPADAVLLGTL